MSWPKYVLLAIYALSVLAMISTIGKKRDPITPRFAVQSAILTGALAALVVLA